MHLVHAVLVFVLVAISLVNLVEAKDNAIALNSNSRYVSLGSAFGFAPGGSLNISLRVEPQTSILFIAMYNNEQWIDLSESNDPSCSRASNFRFEFSESVELSLTITQLSLYQLVLINCRRDSLQINGYANFSNPAPIRERVSLEEVSLLPIFTFFSGCSLVLIAAVLLLYYPHRNELLLVYKILICSVLFKFAQVTSQALFLYSDEGLGLLKLLRDVCKAGGDTSLLAAMLLLSLGWKIMKPQLTARERYWIIVCCVIFGMLDLLFSKRRFPQRINAFSVDLSFHVMKFFATFGNIVSVNSNIEELRKDAFEQGPTRISTRFLPRLRAFRDLLWVLIFYLVTPLLLSVIEFMVLEWTEYWFVMVYQQFSQGIVLVSIIYIFRPSKQDCIFVHTSSDVDDNTSVQQTEEPTLLLNRRRSANSNNQIDTIENNDVVEAATDE
eukprot:TRINITY_DN4123_c0_g1_i1.p1 TRINITY_DN4123_c0_g1~~TRINITY_DN4123_c0_g1_i1.p1  ORF type:complete len:441 (-),score=62.87 TRINITY_DN4123_c0_g1_i1:138-1460(-)